MLYVVEYEVCSLIFLTAICVHYYTKKSFHSQQNSLFRLILFCAMGDIAMDIIGAYTISFPHSVSLELNMSINLIYYFLQVLIPAIFFLYLMSLCKMLTVKNRKWILGYMSVVIISEVLLFTNPFTGIFFYFDENLVYTVGAMRPALYGSMFFYMLLTLIYLIRFRKKLMPKHYPALLSFIVIIIAAVVAQLIYTKYLLTGMAMAVSIVIMYLLLQNPGEIFDSMTGALNRDGFRAYIQEQIDSEKRYYIIALSINELRAVNSVFGIQMGNRLIANVVKCLAAETSGEEYVFRVMSNRFAAAYRSKEKAQKALEAFKNKFDRTWDIGGTQIFVSATMCYVFDELDAKTAEDVMTLLEYAFPVAKKLENNSVLRIGDAVCEMKAREEKTDIAVREAVANGDIEVYFQPMYNVKKRCFTALEALMRLRGEKYSDISVGQFVLAAERNGYILNVDEMMLRTVCGFIADGGLENVGEISGVEINLSAVEFMRDDLADVLLGIIGEYGIEPGLLVFEITETAASVAHDVLIKTMEKMTDAGVRFAMDDYGTGYANVAEVTELPFSIIKMDKSMFDMSLSKDERMIIFEDTVYMLELLGKKIVVEGIETREQAAKAAELGVDVIQGFYYAKPMPMASAAAFVMENNAATRKKEGQGV